MKGLPQDFSKCSLKFDAAFVKAELRAGGTCRTSGDAPAVGSAVDAYCQQIAGSVTQAAAGPCTLLFVPNVDLEEEPGTGGCPPGMTRIDTYCIDVFEAALVVNDGTASAWSPYLDPGTMNVRAVSVRGAVPQGYINGVRAEIACMNAGKRLCTDAEWLRACQGPSGFSYPYGDTREDGRCNDARAVHPAVEYFGSSDPWVFTQIGHPCLNQLPDTLDRTGANSGCSTVEGVFDMMGNLHEWTDDPAGTFRGGFYVDTRINGEGCLYRTTAHDGNHSDFSTGFRCCADPSSS